MLVLLLSALPAGAAERSVRGMLAGATVRLANGCTGAFAERTQLIATAFHCVRDRDVVTVRTAGGQERTAWVVATDERADQAVLFLEQAEHVTPLRVARRPAAPGSVLYFSGHPDRLGFQEARVDRVGVCPSLPELPNALFTTVKGRPGDSGAPLVDGAGSIVGLVHGGAQCEIATPADTLSALVDLVLRPTD
jgi:S1-C subfamily serine protease